MSYRIEWVISKNPKAFKSSDFYEFYDDYKNEFGGVDFETYKRYCRTAKAQLSLGAVTEIISEEEVKTDTDIKVYNINHEKHELNIEAHSYSLRTIEDLIAYAEIDTEKWVCAEQTANKWGSVSNDCYQIKGRFRLKKFTDVTPEEYAEVFKELTEEYIPKYRNMNYPKVTSSGNLAEICLFDSHFGSLIWGDESSGVDYDINIASDMFDESIDHFMHQTHGEVERYLLPLGNDFFNSDSLYNETTKGTPQHEDVSWKKSFLAGEKVFIKNIDKLACNAPVDILIIPGNHDEQRIFYMGQFLSAWYRDSERVNVILNYKPRQYYKWGQSLIGFTHGKDELKGSLPILMCQEAPQLFASTKYQEWHVGHLHSLAEKKTRIAYDNFGIREMVIPTLIPTAEYASKKGYMQMNEAMCFIWNENKGKVTTYYYHP